MVNIEKKIVDSMKKSDEGVFNEAYAIDGNYKAYIDPSDSSIVAMTLEQSNLFNYVVDNITFAPNTSKKYQLESIIDMLNNPDKYNLRESYRKSINWNSKVKKAPIK